ncbi:hypothetical protein TNCV_5039251 [Trichonephila clavipes]|nr:hypothetical protein TNCV_5039251 [Trichonephila clavipes]
MNFVGLVLTTSDRRHSPQQQQREDFRLNGYLEYPHATLSFTNTHTFSGARTQKQMLPVEDSLLAVKKL